MTLMKTRSALMALVIVAAGCQQKTQLQPMKESFQSLQGKLAEGWLPAGIAFESLPITAGALSGHEMKLGRDGASAFEFIVKDGKVYQIARTFPIPVLTAKQRSFAQLMRKTPAEILDMAVSSEAGAFFFMNAEHAIGASGSVSEGPLHDAFKRQTVDVFRNGGAKFTFIDGYVFGCSNSGDGYIRMELMSESVCKAMGPQACVSANK